MHNWNLATIRVLINDLYKRSLEALGHISKILQSKNGQKVDKLEPIYLGNYRYWRNRFVIFEHTINRISFGHDCLPLLENYFFVSFLFGSFFLFLPRLSTFILLNALYSKFERLKISGRIFVRPKLGVPDCGYPPQLGPPKLWTFKPLEPDGSNFWNG